MAGGYNLFGSGAYAEIFVENLDEHNRLTISF